MIEEERLSKKESLILSMGVSGYQLYENRGKLIQHLQNRIAGLNKKISRMQDQAYGGKIERYEQQIKQDVLALTIQGLRLERDEYREKYEQVYRELQEARRVEAGNGNHHSSAVPVYDRSGIGRILR